MSEPVFLYAAYCEHGKIRAACVDDMATTMRAAKNVAGFQKWAARVDRVQGPLEIALWNCEPCDAKRSPKGDFMNRPALTATTGAWDAYTREIRDQVLAIILEAEEHNVTWIEAFKQIKAVLDT